MNGDVLRRSPGKLYLHVATLMRRRLDAGDWAPGQKLPPLADLAAEFDVATVTIRQAVAILEADGLLRRRQGVGTFVEDSIAAKPTFAVGLDWPSLLDMITKSTPRLIRAADGLTPPSVPGTKPVPAYRYLKRVNSVNGLPCLVADAYIDSRIYNRARRRFDEETIIPLIEEIGGVEIAHCRQVLTIGQADLETATLLNIPVNTPMGDIRRVLTDQDGNMIYLNDVSYRGDLVEFEIAFDLDPAEQARQRRTEAQPEPRAGACKKDRGERGRGI